MQIIIENNLFKQAISKVSRVISSNTPVEILSGIKLLATKEGLTIIGNNSNFTTEITIPALDNNEKKQLNIIKTGSIVIPAKYLNEIVKKLPCEIHLETFEDNSISIHSERISTILMGWDSSEFPILPEVNYAEKLKINSHSLVEGIKQTAFAVSKNESRPVLTGVNFSITSNELSLIATDSHRLSLKKFTLDTNNINGSYIIPTASLYELLKLINDSTSIDVFFSENYVAFKTKDIFFVSRVITGKYPDTSTLIETKKTMTMTLEKDKLLSGIDRACLFANETTYNNVYIEIQERNSLKIYSNSTPIGKIEEFQPIKKIEGEGEVNLTLNGVYLIEVLKAITYKEVQLSIGGAMQPIIITPVNKYDQIHLISPVRS